MIVILWWLAPYIKQSTKPRKKRQQAKQAARPPGQTVPAKTAPQAQRHEPGGRMGGRGGQLGRGDAHREPAAPPATHRPASRKKLPASRHTPSPLKPTCTRPTWARRARHRGHRLLPRFHAGQRTRAEPGAMFCPCRRTRKTSGPRPFCRA